MAGALAADKPAPGTSAWRCEVKARGCTADQAGGSRRTRLRTNPAPRVFRKRTEAETGGNKSHRSPETEPAVVTAPSTPVSTGKETAPKQKTGQWTCRAGSLTAQMECGVPIGKRSWGRRTDE